MDAVFWDLAAMPGAALAPWKGRAVPQGAGTAAVHPWDVGTRFWVGDMRVTSSKAQPRASKTHHYLVNPEARTSTSESIKKTNHKLAYSGGSRAAGSSGLGSSTRRGQRGEAAVLRAESSTVGEMAALGKGSFLLAAHKTTSTALLGPDPW